MIPVRLPCPQCMEEGRRALDKGPVTIGNRGAVCRSCARWEQLVRRRLLTQLKRDHPDLYERTRSKVKADLYPGVVEQWLADQGVPDAEGRSGSG